MGYGKWKRDGEEQVHVELGLIYTKIGGDMGLHTGYERGSLAEFKQTSETCDGYRRL